MIKKIFVSQKVELQFLNPKLQNATEQMASVSGCCFLYFHLGLGNKLIEEMHWSTYQSSPVETFNSLIIN